MRRRASRISAFGLYAGGDPGIHALIARRVSRAGGEADRIALGHPQGRHRVAVPWLLHRHEALWEAARLPRNLPREAPRQRVAFLLPSASAAHLAGRLRMAEVTVFAAIRSAASASRWRRLVPRPNSGGVAAKVG